MQQLAKTDLLVLDDWGLEKMTLSQRNDMLEIMEDRHGLRSTLITSQLPITQWHKSIGDATLADAILDRLVHGAYRLELKGGSMRRAEAGSEDDAPPPSEPAPERTSAHPDKPSRRTKRRAPSPADTDVPDSPQKTERR